MSHTPVKDPGRRQFLKWSLGTLAAAALWDAGWVERTCVEFTQSNINAPFAGARTLTCVQVTDLHLNDLMDFHHAFARRVNALHPDFIFFTGDIIDRKDKLGLADEFLSFFDGSAAKKAAILGNWEHWCGADLAALKNIYQKHGIDFLVNSGKRYALDGKNILVTGVDDPVNGYADLDTALGHYAPNDGHILLCHAPAYIDAVRHEQKKIDAVLCGHTHGGQINIFGFIPLLPRGSGGYVQGWYRESAPPMYVCRGIGTTFLPLRFGAQAEVAVLNFYV